jgi:hypothetical protein
MPKLLGCCRRRQKIKPSPSGAAPPDRNNPTSPPLSAVVVPASQHFDDSITSSDGANLPVVHVPHEVATTRSKSQASQADATAPIGNEPSHRPQGETPRLGDSVMTQSTHEDLQSVPDPVPVEDKSKWSKVAYSTFKISLALAAEVADSFAPLKSAVGVLSVILSNYDVSSSFASTESRLDH